MSSRAWQLKYDPQQGATQHHAEDAKKLLKRITTDNSRSNQYNADSSANVSQVDESKELRNAAFILQLKQRVCTRWSVLYMVTFMLAAVLYYCYLASLYLVDEVYDAKGPQELELVERFTIRVAAPKSGTSLANFVQEYSICPAVAEIQVLWNHVNPAPSKDSFVYSKTHCPVVFEQVHGKPASYATSLDTVTEGVLLLDVGIKLSCKDLTFAHSVWRSGKKSLVGFFPRLHAAPEAVASDQLSHKKIEAYGHTYYGRYHVWWNSLYSIMLPAGVFADTRMLQDSGKSTALTEILRADPHCYHMGLSVWAASWEPASFSLASSGRGSPPPMWVKVPVAGKLDADHISAVKHGTCLDKLTRELKLLPHQHLRYATSKSVRASDSWFW